MNLCGHIIASKRDNRSFDWVPKGVKAKHWNLWKDMSLELPTFTWFFCVGGDDKDMYLWEDLW